MALTKLVFRPGINRETTAYANEGGWWDCDLVRFRAGKPESIGGWTRYTQSEMLGVARGLISWTTLNGAIYSGVGTNLKYYIVGGGALNDITPIRETTTAGAVTFDATTGSSVIKVTDTSNGVFLNDFVTFSGAASLGGNVTAPILNAQHQVTRVIDASNYEITVSVTANSSDSGDGGASVIGIYQINTGLDTSVVGTGWGAGAWSRGTWGSGADTSLPGAQLRTWSQDNFGEDLLICVHDGGIYYWDASAGLGTRAVALEDLAGAQAAPTVAKQVIVSERDRHVIAFGCDPEADPGVQDPLIIRFSDQESPTEWRTLPTTTAGELRIGTGSEIICAVQTKQQVVVFTDSSVHAMQYIGDPFTFGLQEVSSAISIMGQNAAVAVGDVVFWMGKNEFYAYDGAVVQIPCDVKEYVFDGLNKSQGLKVYAGHMSSFSEVWWFYPSSDSTENDSYVVYNYEQKIWYYGTMSRTSWIDRGVQGFPIAASPDGYLYYHENGLDDGSVNPPAALAPYIESSVVDIGEGDQFMFATRIIPDLTFRNSTNSPVATFTIKARNFPGGAYFASDSDPVTKTASHPVEQFTVQLFTRLRGRSMSLRVESNQTGTAWRLGDPRIDLRTDGRK
ncbi:hypothetical protein UFOVP858_74 [uncultured Caudovirales phage]|uniref:Uncharacterized protein n=1 Tax=uncultured Caudovirales phage TaxID=2100421 RepID=A0A6J5P9K1_9CAUD|nr:hypothetical protein UFOVP858_74 [uncultured Caudovirales phage]